MAATKILFCDKNFVLLGKKILLERGRQIGVPHFEEVVFFAVDSCSVKNDYR